MLDLSNYLNLSLALGAIIALSVFLYVLLDGFDLGVGILFPFAPTNNCRDKIMNSVAPFWDGNETWLVLGGGTLFAGFPLAYSILMPALYIPIITMLLGLILRGVAFEFRFKSDQKIVKLWDYCFHFGSVTATFAQGVMLGAFVQGIKVNNRIFVGDSFDWLTPFSLMTGIALIFAYSLLGATWVILKTEKETQLWAYKSALYVLVYVALFIGVVSVWTPLINEQIYNRWFDVSNLMYLCPILLTTIFIIVNLFYTLINI